jgi:chemotaxis protein MotB
MAKDKLKVADVFGPSQEEDTDDWLVTYSDMVTLLLTFFIVIVAISTIDPMKYERVAESMEKSVGNKEIEQEERVSLQEIYMNLENIVKEEGLTEQAEVNYSPVGVTMRFKGNMLFNSGSANLSDKATSVLEKLGEEIKSRPYRIAVEGHTDNRPIHTSVFPSNWELSAARASRVVRFFLDNEVQPYKLRAIGRADTKPLLPNFDEDGNPLPDNQAFNRRVEIIFLANSAD